MNIMDMIASQVNNPSVLGKLGQSVGADTDKVKQLTELGLPAMLRAMGRNVKTEEGAQSLAGALDQHQDDPVDDVASFLGQVDMNDGAKILGHLFPRSQTRVQNNLASKTGLDKSQVSGVLSQLAPLLLGTLGQQKKQQQLDVSGVVGLLKGAAGKGLLSKVTDMLDANNDGSILDDVGRLLGKK
ncbi:MAG: DUF937 domain-containing protein [Eubacteriales bacterium]|nr:DUF937 domain-containing protein [Eubacteriales bacterium]MDD4139189.1 DUF937 domain-containing protein [Eubacteriales bacterium]MDD4744837.1 DUF937 domain-containing protein [Eubacteriales bacterium]